MDFEILDISGDVGLKAYGSSCEEAFINVGIGMYSLITNIEQIKGKKEFELEVGADSIEGLLVNYLNELIFQFDANGFVGGRIEIEGLSLFANEVEHSRSIGTVPVHGAYDCSLKARVSGEDFDPERHERKLLLKAATYHKIRVEKTGDKWELEVVFDI